MRGSEQTNVPVRGVSEPSTTPVTPNSFLVLPTQTVRMRRFLINLQRRSPAVARNLVVLNGDAISFDAIFRDRDVAWNILDVPYSLVFFSHRNPIDRAFSDYLHMRTVGAVRRSFREQIAANLRDTRRQIGLDWPFLEYGHYHEQLSRWFAHFPRSQFHISLYEQLEHRPLELLASLQAFLGVEPRFDLDVSVRHNVPRVPRSGAATALLRTYARLPALGRCVPTALRRRLGARLVLPRTALAMDPADRTYLAGYYRDEIRRLSALLDRDLVGWLEPAAGQ